MNERNLYGSWFDAKLGLCILGDETSKRLTILIGMNLRAENIFQVLVLEYGCRDRSRDPKDLLLLLHFRRERDGVRT